MKLKAGFSCRVFFVFFVLSLAAPNTTLALRQTGLEEQTDNQGKAVGPKAELVSALKVSSATPANSLAGSVTAPAIAAGMEEGLGKHKQIYHETWVAAVWKMIKQNNGAMVMPQPVWFSTASPKGRGAGRNLISADKETNNIVLVFDVERLKQLPGSFTEDAVNTFVYFSRTAGFAGVPLTALTKKSKQEVAAALILLAQNNASYPITAAEIQTALGEAPGSSEEQIKIQTGMEERTVDTYIDALQKVLDKYAELIGDLDLAEQEELTNLPALRRRFQQEIVPLRGHPEAFFDYVAQQDRPPSSFQNEVRTAIAQRIGVSPRQIVFLSPDDHLLWMLFNSFDFIEESSKSKGMDFFISIPSGGLRHLLIIRADLDDMTGLGVIAHEGAHAVQSPRILLLYGDPLVRTIVEGVQLHVEEETILWLASQKTLLAEQVKAVVQQAYSKLKSRHSDSMEQVLRWVVQEAAKKRTGGAGEFPPGSGSFPKQLTELLTHPSTGNGYANERFFVNKLIGRAGQTAVRRFYQEGDVRGLRQATGLGPLRFDGLRAFLRHWNDNKIFRILDTFESRNAQAIGLRLAVRLILEPQTYSRADTNRLLQLIRILASDKTPHRRQLIYRLNKVFPATFVDKLVPKILQYMRQQINDEQILDEIATLAPATGLEETDLNRIFSSKELLQSSRVIREVASVQRQTVVFRFDPSLISGDNMLAKQMELDRIEKTLLRKTPGWSEISPMQLLLLSPGTSSQALARAGSRVIEIIPEKSFSGILSEWGIALAAQKAYFEAMNASPDPSVVFRFPVDVELYQGLNRQDYLVFQESLAAAA